MNGGKYPHMPFNQQMSFPSELTLRETPDGLRRVPPTGARTRIAARHTASFRRRVQAGLESAGRRERRSVDLRAEIAVESAKEIKFDHPRRGTGLRCRPKRELRLLGKTAPLKPIDGVIKLQVLVDRSSIEVFANDGAVTMASCFIPTKQEGKPPLAMEATGATVKSLDIWELKSCWPD